VPTIDDTIARTMAVAVAGCCGNDAWRGRFCDYHRGMEAGLEMALNTIDRTVHRRYPEGAHNDGSSSPGGDGVWRVETPSAAPPGTEQFDGLEGG